MEESNGAEYGYLIDPMRGETIAPATKEEREESDRLDKENTGNEQASMLEIPWRDLVLDGRISKRKAMHLRKLQSRSKKIKDQKVIYAWVKDEEGKY